MSDRLRILALEPYYGGSHKAVLDLLGEFLDAEWTPITMPARKWKWRMRGAAINMADQARELAGQGRDFDLIFASTFLNLAEFRGLAGPAFSGIPAVVYFHENQLVYPNRHTAEWDYQFPLTNITTALSAERCLFNTKWNLDEFLAAIPPFIKEFPDNHPKGLAEKIGAKSSVLAPPFDPRPFDVAPVVRGGRCRIVWPHRWEHDKNPEEFLGAVGVLADEGLDFEVAIAGQAFAETKDIVEQAAQGLGNRLVHCREPNGRDEYARLLASSDVAVSTASNEFFGIAMMESCYAGCTPLVPDRLAYRELYDERFRYAGFEQLVAALREAVLSRPEPNVMRDTAERYTVGSLLLEYESELRSVRLK